MKPSVGRIVHFVPARYGGELDGKHLAAIVTEVVDREAGLVYLQAFSPRPGGPEPFMFVYPIPFDEGGADGTWHWPERED